MRIQKRLTNSAIFAVIIFFLSMFIPIVPCQTAPLVPNPTYQWNICTLNPDSINLVGVERLYFGYTTSITSAYFVLIIISFVLAMLVLHFVAKPRKK
jgi:hypothetical protein